MVRVRFKGMTMGIEYVEALSFSYCTNKLILFDRNGIPVHEYPLEKVVQAVSYGAELHSLGLRPKFVEFQAAGVVVAG